MNTLSDVNNKELAHILYQDIVNDIAYYREKYPARKLPDGACVTRVAPSPTGFMHIGGVYMALISRKIARQTNGIFYLRIEDTDKKREVAGAKEIIIKSLEDYDLSPDEGSTSAGEKGAYGPYTQSERMPVYLAFVKQLITSGHAYPCFATEKEISDIRAKQEAQLLRPGYYGKWAIWRDASIEKIEAELQKKTPYVIRLRSAGVEGEEFKHQDLIKGEIVMPVNTQDFVLLKSDGLPTYHLAHLVDDYLMGTTHVIRGDEWVSSLPLHYELWSIIGVPAPKYCHVPPILKIGEGGGKRKLSKRSDPEASVVYYQKTGYPESAVIDYLMNLANSNYEDWRKENHTVSSENFIMEFDRFNKSGPLFDETKLKDISKGIIADMDSRTVYNNVHKWAKQYDPEFSVLLDRYVDYSTSILGIERGEDTARKDLATWSSVPNEFSYFYDENFTSPNSSGIQTVLSKDEMISFVNKYSQTYDLADTKDVWMEKIRTLGSEYKLAPNIKTFKQNPAQYRGQIGEVAKIIRFALSGREQTPDLYSMMKVMGVDRCMKRLQAFVA